MPSHRETIYAEKGRGASEAALRVKPKRCGCFNRKQKAMA